MNDMTPPPQPPQVEIDIEAYIAELKMMLAIAQDRAALQASAAAAFKKKLDAAEKTVEHLTQQLEAKKAD